MQEHLADRPSKEDICIGINQVQSGKASGEDGIPVEIYRHGGEAIVCHLFDRYSDIFGQTKIFHRN